MRAGTAITLAIIITVLSIYSTKGAEENKPYYSFPEECIYIAKKEQLKENIGKNVIVDGYLRMHTGIMLGSRGFILVIIAKDVDKKINQKNVRLKGILNYKPAFVGPPTKQQTELTQGPYLGEEYYIREPKIEVFHKVESKKQFQELSGKLAYFDNVMIEKDKIEFKINDLVVSTDLEIMKLSGNKISIKGRCKFIPAKNEDRSNGLGDMYILEEWVAEVKEK